MPPSNRARSAVAAISCALWAWLACLAAGQAGQTQNKPLLVFAAASLKGVLDDGADAYTAATGTAVALSYAGTPALAKQIEQGAPADVFVSADRAWIDYLANKSLIKDDTVVDLLSNSLVLIAAAKATTNLKIAPGFALSDVVGQGRLALADTANVPAGKYAKAALTFFGVWNSLSGKIAESENVRAALTLVAREEAPLGVVYRTDALSEPRVRIVDSFPLQSHPPIRYPAAITTSAGNAEAARDFLSYLSTPAAVQIFEKAGFQMLQR